MGAAVMRLGFVAGALIWLVSGWGTLAGAELAPICQRGAVAGPVPLSFLLSQEAAEYYEESYARMDPGAFDPGDDAGWEAWHRASILAQAIEWPGILADRAAKLPAGAHDLPWLILLAELESTYGNPVSVLLINPQSILLPDLLPLMQRHGMTEEAEVLRQAMVLFADWDINPAERFLAIYGLDGTLADPALEAAVRALAEAYPKTRGAEAAALRLLEQVPDLAQLYQARMAAADDGARLDQLIGHLRQTCLAGWWETPDEADRAYLSLGTAQAALLMMDDLATTLDGTSAQVWLDGVGATMAPHLLKVLDIRGEAELAKGLRRAMAEFPQPFPREMEARWTVFESFPPEAWARIDTALPEDGYDRLRAAMLALALESGLLAGQ
jgi:hypothetical protein